MLTLCVSSSRVCKCLYLRLLSMCGVFVCLVNECVHYSVLVVCVCMLCCVLFVYMDHSVSL